MKIVGMRSNPFARKWRGYCFDCRFASRRCRLCPHCGSSLFNLHGENTPRKNDSAGWERLRWVAIDRYRPRPYQPKKGRVTSYPNVSIPKLKSHKGYGRVVGAPKQEQAR